MNPTQASFPSYSCCFEKTGSIRFISHLDLTRTFHRAFARAGIPLKFSEGFTPHPKFSFALPLSVGTESLCEWASFTLCEDCFSDTEALKEVLQRQMPEGIRIRRILPQTRKLSEIAFCSYDVFLPAASPALIPAIQTALKGELTVQKKNKKGKIVEKNLSPGMQSVSVSERDGGIFLQAVLSAAGEEYLKPEALLQALAEQLPSLDQGRKRILRTQVYSADMTAFYDNQNQSLKG